MIKELFELHNIKYVISVDDCYFESDEDDIKALLFGKMKESFNDYEEHIGKIGMSESLKEIKEMIDIGGDKDLLIGDFLDGMAKDQLMELYTISASVESSHLMQEKDNLIRFLEWLKKNQYIERFELFSSTKSVLESDCLKDVKDSEAVLWLIDRNFERVNESAEAGLELAKTIVGREGGPANYIYILSSMEKDMEKDENAIEEEFDSYLSDSCSEKEASFIYYLYKQRILPDKPNRIAKGLAQGFKRKVCYELFNLYTSSMRSSIDASSKKICKIRQETLNYLFDEMVKENGESYLEFLNRFVRIFQLNEYQRTLSEKFELIADKMQYYKKISNIVLAAGDRKKETEKVKKFRKIELYNYYVNRQHCEISMGDIFKINEQYYFLASQPCDTCLRVDGKRVLKEANLLLICDETDSQPFIHKLSCFETYKTPIVKYRSRLIFPFEILDLCVLNIDGRAALPIEFLEEQDFSFKLFTENYCNRIKDITDQLNQILNNNKVLECFFSNNKKIGFEKARLAYENNKLVKPELLQYREEKNMIIYDVKRICRLDELLSIDILNEYGTNLSRIGHAFDFTERSRRNTQ